MQKGRKKIYTDVEEINHENVISVLREAMVIHEQNENAFDYLLRYEEGEQPLPREKTYRPEINTETNCGLANQISEFKQGFHWGNPITLIQNRDNGNEDAIQELNDMFDTDNSFSKTQEIGRYCEIGGYGIEYIDFNKQYEDGKSYWTSIPLDPRTSFIIYSSAYADRRKMMGVSFRVDRSGNRYFTCITKNMRYEIINISKITNGKITKDKWNHTVRSGVVNPIGKIPFVEWLRSYDRLGCFERQIAAINALNIMESDFVNDVDQNTQCVWFGVDINFPVDEEGNVVKPSSNDWLLAHSNENGKPSLQPMVVPYDYTGILSNIQSTKASILESAYVPCRNDNSGGSTGVAMSDATGWSGAEMIAAKQQALQEQAKMEEVDIVLAILKQSPDVPADCKMKNLSLSDVKPNIKRQRTYELSTKTNALVAMLNSGIYGEDAIKTINLFDDPNEVWNHSKDMIIANQEKNSKDSVDTTETGLQDESDQIGNSPNIDGMKMENKED